MAIDKNSNGFTFGFAVVMAIIVAAVLSLAAVLLKPAQDENKKQEKMKSILTSVGVMSKDDDMSEAPAVFGQTVTERITLNAKGEVISNTSGDIEKTNVQDAFNVDVLKQYKEFKANSRSAEDREYPLFVCKKDGEMLYVVPLVGTGLWGPIWGYVAFSNDLNTIVGINFDHQGETPGLGAEITTPMFTDQYIGKTIMDNGKFVSVTVHKGGGGKTDPHGVDGITGGTITSKGVGSMMENTLKPYIPYFNTIKAQ